MRPGGLRRKGSNPTVSGFGKTEVFRLSRQEPRFYRAFWAFISASPCTIKTCSAPVSYPFSYTSYTNPYTKSATNHTLL